LEITLNSPESDQIGSEQYGRTITLSRSDIECAARLLHLITGQETSPETKEQQPATVDTEEHGRELFLSKARRIIRNRQLRTEFFNRAMFSEAAWDILLVLYVTDSAGTLQTQATLSKGLATPPTTIQRWVDYLEKERLVRRQPHPTDRRIAFVSLMDKGRNALENYLAAVAE